MSNIHKALQERILVLDGAMGTMLQAYKFTEEAFRGERFKDYPSPLTREQRFIVHHTARGYHKRFMVNILKQVPIS